MKALVKTGKGVGFSCMDVAVPVPRPGEVLVKVHATGVCGSDIHTYLWDAYAESITSRLGVSFPFVVGHEYAGTIDKVAPDVQGFAPGDRVSMETHVFCGKCFHCLNGMAHNCTSTGWYGFGYGGSFAEYCIAPARIIFKLPDKVSFEEAAIFEPAGVAMRAVEESHIVPGDTVVVLGAGPIGLMAIQILNVCGAARVIAVDIVDYRLSIAEKYGAIPPESDESGYCRGGQKINQRKAWCGRCT